LIQPAVADEIGAAESRRECQGSERRNDRKQSARYATAEGTAIAKRILKRQALEFTLGTTVWLARTHGLQLARFRWNNTTTYQG
jgi:hypothetical protein